MKTSDEENSALMKISLNINSRKNFLFIKINSIKYILKSILNLKYRSIGYIYRFKFNFVN